MRDETFLQNTDRGIFPAGSLYAKGGVSFKITEEQRDRAQKLVGSLGERLCPGDTKKCYCQPVACESITLAYRCPKLKGREDKWHVGHNRTKPKQRR